MAAVEEREAPPTARTVTTMSCPGCFLRVDNDDLEDHLVERCKATAWVCGKCTATSTTVGAFVEHFSECNVAVRQCAGCHQLVMSVDYPKHAAACEALQIRVPYVNAAPQAAPDTAAKTAVVEAPSPAKVATVEVGVQANEQERRVAAAAAAVADGAGGAFGPWDTTKPRPGTPPKPRGFAAPTASSSGGAVTTGNNGNVARQAVTPTSQRRTQSPSRVIPSPMKLVRTLSPVRTMAAHGTPVQKTVGGSPAAKVTRTPPRAASGTPQRNSSPMAHRLNISNLTVATSPARQSSPSAAFRSSPRVTQATPSPLRRMNQSPTRPNLIKRSQAPLPNDIVDGASGLRFGQLPIHEQDSIMREWRLAQISTSVRSKEIAMKRQVANSNQSTAVVSSPLPVPSTVASRAMATSRSPCTAIGNPPTNQPKWARHVTPPKTPVRQDSGRIRTAPTPPPNAPSTSRGNSAVTTPKPAPKD